LFERQPRYFTLNLARTIGLLALALGLLFKSTSVWTDVVAAALLAVASGQVGLVFHDAAHRQIFRAGRQNDALLLATGPMLIAVSAAWWKDKHDRHHAHPNDVTRDPDVQIGVLAFSPEQAIRKRGYERLLTRHQALLLPFLLLLEGVQLRAASVRHLATHGVKYRRTELVLLAVHAVGYVSLLVAAVGLVRALVVIAVHQALFGLYVGSIFAPNHKGMEMIHDESTLSFVERQVRTARNVRGNRFLDWWFGGLNYQIEHHLLPTVPRNRLADARDIVRPFCAERGITYVETRFWASYRELLESMHANAEPVRDGVAR
jgi:fatty acid desaturase